MKKKLVTLVFCILALPLFGSFQADQAGSGPLATVAWCGHVSPGGFTPSETAGTPGESATAPSDSKDSRSWLERLIAFLTGTVLDQ